MKLLLQRVLTIRSIFPMCFWKNLGCAPAISGGKPAIGGSLQVFGGSLQDRKEVLYTILGD
jgi:hypothetical protein